VRRSEAKKLFFEYDGSLFFMSRDGVDERFAAARVPRETQAHWLAELTERRLAALGEPGNHQPISFLIHHGDYTRLEPLARAEPLGFWWERCAFLEALLQYATDRRQRARRWLVRATLQRVLDQANRLRRRARSEASRRRVDELIASLAPRKPGRRRSPETEGH